MSFVTRKLLPVLLMLVLTISSCMLIPATASATDDFIENGNMNLDVVFVLDSSGSMLESDPNRVALDAMNLFVDLCDETCSAGYAVYTEKIKSYSSLVDLGDSKKRQKLKKNISALEYDPNGDTDIALGLTKAMKIFKSSKTEEGRKKAIVLLSDGNTHLLYGPRTVKESQKEMKSTLKSLAEMEIPVYSIGLNYDGTLDKKEIEKISKQTNGKSYSTKTSDKLTGILTDIFSDIYKLEGKQLEIKNGNVKIDIKNSSVFYVNIIIRSTFSAEELNPVLTSPRKKKVSLTDNKNVRMTSADTYTLIKLIYPESGVWNLHLENATNKNCSVTQLDFYSVTIKQSIAEKAQINTPVRVEAVLSDGDKTVDDNDLLETIQMATTVKGPAGEFSFPLTRDPSGVFYGEFTPEIIGEYTIFTKAITETFQKESDPFVMTAVEALEESVVIPDDGQTEDPNAALLALIITIITYIGIGIVVVVAIIAIVIIVRAVLKAKAEARQTPPPPPPPPPPKPQYIPPPPPKPQPAAKPPEYVDIPLVEHGSLEELIKRGADDTFNAKAEDYQSDASLDGIIRKGSDDSFTAKAEDYASDAALEGIVRKGTDDSFNAKPEDYASDAALDQIVRKGSDDAFDAKPEDYASDAALDQIVRKGSDDAFSSANADRYTVDPSLSAIIRTGGNGLEGSGIQKEEPDGSDDSEE